VEDKNGMNSGTAGSTGEGGYPTIRQQLEQQEQRRQAQLQQQRGQIQGGRHQIQRGRTGTSIRSTAPADSARITAPTGITGTTKRRPSFLGSRSGHHSNSSDGDDEDDEYEHNDDHGGDGRPSTAPARIIGLSIDTGGDGGLGHDSSFDDASLSSPRPQTASAATGTAVAPPLPFDTAPSRLQNGNYDSSDDDMTPVLLIGSGANGGGGAVTMDASARCDGSAVDGEKQPTAREKGAALMAEKNLKISGGGADSSAHVPAPDRYTAHSSTFDDNSAWGGEESSQGIIGDGGDDRSGNKSATGSARGMKRPRPGKVIAPVSSRNFGKGRGQKELPTRKNAVVASTDNSISCAVAEGKQVAAVASHCVIPESGGTKVAAPDGEDMWAIERILGRRYNAAQRRVEYLIVWRGFEEDPSENTWEPQGNLSVPSLNFVHRRWGDTKPSPLAPIEMTDPALDEERVDAYFKWMDSQKSKNSRRGGRNNSPAKKKQSPKKKKSFPKGNRELLAFLEGDTTILPATSSGGMLDTRSFVKQTLLDLVRKVRRKVDQYGFFSGPVDPVKSECLDYYDIIDKEKEAMDLDTIEEMIVGGKIFTVDAFETNLKRIAHCCRKYNTNPQNFVRIEGDKIEGLASPIIEVARRTIDKRVGTSSGDAVRGADDEKNDEWAAAAAPTTGVGKRRHDAALSKMDADTDRSPKRLRRTAKGLGSSHAPSKEVHDGPIVSSVAGENRTFDQACVEEQTSGRDWNGRSKRLRCSNDYTPTPERRSSRRSATSGKKAFGGADDASIVSKRPTRVTRKSVDYSESARKTGGDDESCSDMSASISSSRSVRSKSGRPKLDRNKYYDRDIEGSEVPPCKRDLSTSDIKKCTLRKEWLSNVPAMMNVCNEAARRSTLDANPAAERYEKPLSDVYMTERLEYDSIIFGLTVRTKVSPHYLQGFIVITDFQVWRRTFRWATVDEPAAGITPSSVRLHATDVDGSLAAALQSVKTRGSDTRDGIVFERVAEIALLGGLRCGGSLVKSILAELRQSGKYDYVVLQATKIAISFYEKLGFKRVGAVTRFKDNQNLPEVQYRHWSEIVGNEAMEASYMMALRLQDFGTSKTAPAALLFDKISMEDRRAEALLSLKSAYMLLADSIFFRTTGSSKTYVHTLRELLSTATDFAKCAGDENMIHVIKRALEECSTTKIGGSKKILRDELNIPAGKAAANRSTSLTSVSSLSDGESIVTEYHHSTSCITDGGGGVDVEEYSDVRLRIRVNAAVDDAREAYGDDLYARVSEFSAVLPRQIGVTVRLGNSVFEPEGEKECDALFATLPLPRTRRNADDANAAAAIALANLREILRDAAFLDESNPSHFPSAVMPGHVIQIRVLARDNNLMWLPAKVKRHCKEHELPEDDDATIHNSFILKTVEDGKIEEFSRILDPASRGIGRDWCTSTDWYSFQVLPHEVLDELLVGSWVEYPGENGTRRAGFVEQRLGTGLQSDLPHWRLVTYDQRDREEMFEYSAAALKEAVTISDRSMVKAAAIIRNLPPMAFDQGSFEMASARQNPPSLAGVDPQAIEAWALKRLEGCNLELFAARDEKEAMACGRKRKRRGKAGATA